MQIELSWIFATPNCARCDATTSSATMAGSTTDEKKRLPSRTIADQYACINYIGQARCDATDRVGLRLEQSVTTRRIYVNSWLWTQANVGTARTLQ